MKTEDRKKALKAFGQPLKELTEFKGLIQLKLGERCLMDASNINKYEAGQREPGLATLMVPAKGPGINHRELAAFVFDFQSDFDRVPGKPNFWPHRFPLS